MAAAAAAGRVEVDVKADGACMFRALARQLYRGDEARHGHVRQAVVAQLQLHAKRYAGFAAARSWPGYLARMGTSNEWGDHLVLMAAADLWGCRISVVDADTGDVTEVASNNAFSGRRLWLKHYRELHYASLEEAGG